jgi:hypothetical protein
LKIGNPEQVTWVGNPEEKFILKLPKQQVGEKIMQEQKS